MKQPMISNCFSGELFKRNLKVLQFSDAFPSKAEHKYGA